jgi:uncharacterized 2Fe-2S/4Fe-4S cluster protein (DUF4445 family)
MNRPEEHPVVFQPGDNRVFVLSGTRLQEAATAAGLVLDAPCGGEGTCGKCRVVVSEGAPPPTAEERSSLSAEELRAGCRLACQTRVEGPMSVLVPGTSLVNQSYQILTASAAAAPAEGPPVISKRYLELPPPRSGDDTPDLERLERAAGPLDAEPATLADLPRQLRAAGFRGTAVLDQRRLIDFETGNTEWESFGVAVDLGTTTLVAALLDLATGREIRVASRLNPQTRFGDDVLSRILLARSKPEGLQQLRSVVVEAVDAMIGELCNASGIGRRQVYTVTLAGNTTMQQLFCGIDPSPLGEVPFVPAIRRGHSLAADDGGLEIHPRGRIYILPIIGAFVGGDISGGIFATGLAECSGPTMLIDIGTNGEIVLAADGRLSAASTAAGPAFEGARITQGMRACQGAIEKVVVDDQLRVNVIGHVPPVGLCGSALIDATAELLRHGVLSSQGRLAAPDELPSGLLPDLAARIELRDQQPAFVLADCASEGGGRKIALTQRDIREIQLASGAIRAGIELLLKQRGLRPTDLDRVLLAGGFGNYIRRSNAQRMGLLPPEIPHQRIRYHGNTSLAGARLAALSIACREKCDELAARTEHVDLSLDPDFTAVFANAMIFPDVVSDAPSSRR